MLSLTGGRARATVDPERGGRLASLRVGDRELLVGPRDEAHRSIRWGCFLMAPWPGRLADGRLWWRGRTIQLRRTHGRHAIHGLVWAVPWRVERADDTGADLAVDLASAAAEDGWPFGGEVRQSYRLDGDGLTLAASILAHEPMPAALGWHPWFRRDPGGGPALRLEAAGVRERRAMLPTGAVLPLDGRTNLRGGPSLGRRRLDDAYSGARSPAVLRWPDLELRIEFGDECRTVVVHSPAHAVCVEPMTAAPNALGLPDAPAREAGRRDLEAGDVLTATMRIGWS